MIKFRKRQSAITFDDAFPYLAKRYNLKQVAVVQIPEDQLSPTDVQNAVNAVKKYKVKALFSEPGVDNKFNQPNLMAVLFGDILAIYTTDLILTLLVLVGDSIFLLSTL